MKKNMSANKHSASGSTYRPKSHSHNSENWIADHKKLLWGIGGAVVIGAGAMLLLKNRNGSDKYSDTYDELNELNRAALNDNLGEEDVVITTITELE
jgi:hypothetical protein